MKKKLRYTFGFKISLLVANVLCVMALVACFIATYVCLEADLYFNAKYEDTNFFVSTASVDVDNILLKFKNHSLNIDDYDITKTNFRFSIYDDKGNYLIGNSEEKYSNYVGFEYKNSIGYIYYGADISIDVSDAYSQSFMIYQGFNDGKYAFVLVGSLLVVAIIIETIVSCCIAGHRNNKDEIVLMPWDKIPYDIYIIIAVAIMFLYTEVICNLYLGAILSFITILIGLILGYVLCLTLLLSLARRVKKGQWYKNTVLGLLLSGLSVLFGNVSLTIKVIAIFLFALIVPRTIYYRVFVFKLIYWAVMIYVLVYAIKFFGAVKNKTSKMVKGDYSGKIDTSKLIGDSKQYASDLNSLSKGISKAVNDKLEAEKLRMELITNVSHDIKTPLTSIINYVDLLKGKHTVSQRKEYLDIIDKQTQRLKKLTDDVIEVSKASTGNIKVELAKMDIFELYLQAIGEYQEAFQEKQLEVVDNVASQIVNVDGNLMWRVLNNCLNNCLKYSKSNTRVYIDGAVKDDYYQLEIKNTSNQQLNISADELMERFVRGERSRNSEGSGLGLNIAKSLMELQGGSLNIQIDGDLFKVVIKIKED